MPFDFPASKKYIDTKKRTRFFIASPGTHVTRHLEPTESAYKVLTHWIPKINKSVVCLGRDECPLCQANYKLKLENPKDSFDDLKRKGYNGSTPYAFINIYDKTDVKVCPNPDCGEENFKNVVGQFAPSCYKCNTILVSVVSAPSNKVKVMRVNKTLGGLFDQFESATMDEKGDLLPITSYDFELYVSQNGKTSVPKPLVNSREPVDTEEELFDTTIRNGVLNFTADEITKVLRGISVEDIFAARKEQQAEKITTESPVTDADTDDIKAAIDAMFV